MRQQGGRWHNTLSRLLALFCLCASVSPWLVDAPQVAAQTPPGKNAPTDYERLPFMKHDDVAAESAAPSAGGLLLRTCGALLLVLGLLVAAAWAARRWGGQSFAGRPDPETALAVVATLSLGERRTVSAVRFGDRLLLLGATPQAITLLASSERPQRPAKPRMRSVAELLAADEAGAVEAPSFAQALTSASQKLAAGQAAPVKLSAELLPPLDDLADEWTDEVLLDELADARPREVAAK